MGRAIIRQPQVFLMDEPLSNLDAQLRVHMRGEIEALQKRLGVTTVYVTHDQVEAMTMGDRVAVLRAGELQQVDTPTNVYDRPANLFVAGFIGSPPMNLAQATIESRGRRPRRRASADRGSRFPRELAKDRGLEAGSGREVIVGIRPEDLEPRRTDAAGRGSAATSTASRRSARTCSCFFTSTRPGRGARRSPRPSPARSWRMRPSPRASGTPFCATFEPRSPVKIGDRVEVSVDARRLHFFDPETDEAL